jgi:hypothetical protein
MVDDLPPLSLADLATAMSRTNRWGGRGAFALSIAQHQVLLATAVPTRLRKAALIHDVPEIYLGGDVNDKIKRECPHLLAAEDKITRQVFKTFKVPYTEYLEVMPFDRTIRFDERAALWPDDPIARAGKLRGLGVIVEPTAPERAADAWLYFHTQIFSED